MRRLSAQQIERVLCLGAHADDIEIGCGGTILEMLARNARLEVCWVTLSGDEVRATEATTSAASFLDAANNHRLICKSFKDGYFPYDAAIKDFFFELRAEFEPDVVLTHRKEDAHQDHRVVAELTWNTFRDHLILEYEIPKYEGDLGSPNCYVPLKESTCGRKVDLILETFASQSGKPWLTADLLWSTLRLRGIECKSETGFAEAFTGRKVTVDL